MKACSCVRLKWSFCYFSTGEGNEKFIEYLELIDVVSWIANSRTCLASPPPVPGLKSHAILQDFLFSMGFGS